MCALALNAVSEAHLAAWLEGAAESKPTTSNQPALGMPFQRWFKFKEAFAPSFVVESIRRLPYHPDSCCDPFGGSGTTALTCQFLGIEPTTIEVNPFMADVAEAKLTSYDIAELKYAFRTVARQARKSFSMRSSAPSFPGAPATFVEPGIDGRWIFGRAVARAILSLRTAIDAVPDPANARLLRVALGSRLIDLSNVVINGKGRRYRRGWEKRLVTPEHVFASFEGASTNAIADVEAFRRRRCKKYSLLRGDARLLTPLAGPVDFVLTSPPYPNSFDYTDIYNIELWALGYLGCGADNRALRTRTLRSHVQIFHEGEAATDLTPTLRKTYQALCTRRAKLWNRNIPEMVCHYFADMKSVLTGCHGILRDGGHAMLAVGDSRYEGVLIDVPRILTEIAEDIGFELVKTEAVRSMRSSAQQGGNHVLNESLVWLTS